MTVDGRLYDATTPTNGLLDASVALTIQVLNPAKTCILYEEHQTVSTLLSDGYFSVRVGSPTSGSESLKRTSNDSGNSMASVFGNKAVAIPGRSSSGVVCSYTPSTQESRYFRFIVTPSTTGVTSQLSPDLTIDSTPQALVAESLQGLAPTDFIQVNSNTTQAKADSLFGASYAGLTSLLSGTSSLYLQNSTAGTIIPNRATDPGSPVAGQIWYDTTANAMKYYDGTSIQTVGAGGSDPTKLPLAGGTMAGNIAMGGNQISGVGHITQGAQSTLTFGKYTNAQETVLIAALVAGNKGATWFNSDTNKMMYWDGTAAQVILDVASAGAVGDITGVTAGTGLTGGGATGGVTLNIDIGTGATQLFRNQDVPSCNANETLKMSAGPIYTLSCVTVDDSTKLAKSGGTMTGDITMGGSQLLNVSHITQSSQSTLTIGKYTNAQEAVLTAALVAGNKGAMWFNSDTNAMMYWDGSAAQALTNASAAGGDITAVVAGAGLTGGANSGSATVDIGAGTGIVVNANDVAVDVGVTTGKIVQVAASDKLPVIDGSNLTNITAGNLAGTVSVASGGTGQTTYTDGQLLIGNSTGNTLAKATLTSGTGINVTNGNGSITLASTLGTSVDLTSEITGTLPIANGGTGQTTAQAAIDALLPSQGSNSGKYLTTDGTNSSWGTPPPTALSGITAATAVNTIANANNAQIWNWDTLTTETAMSLGSSSMTTGNILSLTDSLNSATSTGTILKLNATGTSNAAVPLMITNAGTGNSLRINDDGTDTDATPVIVDSAGRLGVGTTAPTETLQVNGNTLLSSPLSGANTTLTGGHSSGLTTITVASTTSYPSSGTLWIDTEAMTYTGKTPTTFTGVVRGVLGTTAASHLNGSKIHQSALSLLNDTSPQFMVFSDGAVSAMGAAVGNYSVALGPAPYTNAAGSYATATGWNNKAGGDYSVAMGTGAIASAGLSIALGTQVTTSGGSAVAIGSNTTVSGTNSISLAASDFHGSFSTVSGTGSVGVFLGDSASANVTANQVMAIIGGSVGIGTTTPSTLLDVAGAITSRPNGTATGQTGQLILRELAANGTNAATIRSPDTLAADYVLTLPVDDGNSGQVLTTDGSGALSWVSASAATSVSASAGTVGAPSVSFSGDTDTGFYSSAADTIGVSAGGASLFDVSSAGIVSATAGGGVVTTGNGTAATPTFSFAGDADTGWWRPAANTMAASTGGVERLRIDSSGQLGIGSASPSNLLDVSGGVIASTRNSIGTTSTDALLLTNTTSGAAGVPQYSPALHMHASGYDTTGSAARTVDIRLETRSSSSAAAASYTTFAINQSISGGAYTTPFAIDNYGNIYGSGNVSATGILGGQYVNGGLGTAGSPTYSFTTDTDTGWWSPGANTLSASTGGAERVRIDSSGFVGFGTTSPSAAIDVNGAFHIKGLNGIRFPASDSTAGGSIAIGASALAQQDSLASTAFANTGIGYQALSSASLSTSSTNNTAVGYQAGAGITANGSNTAIGSQAMGTGTGGIGGTAVGRSALKNVTADSNTAVGFNAGLNITNGFRNTVIGTGALSNANAIETVAIGAQAGNSVTGSNNTIIGTKVGSTTLTSGSGNILIGNSVSVDTPASSSTNFLNIGNVLFATGMNGTVASPSGNVGIGTTVPGTVLDIAGAITTRPYGTGSGQTGQIILRELAANGTNTATIRSPDTLAADYVLTLPVDDGVSGQVLQTDGSGVLSWVNAASGSGDFKADGSVPMTDTLKAVSGTLALPGYTFSGDTNTGLYRSAADTIEVVSGGTSVMTLNSGVQQQVKIYQSLGMTNGWGPTWGPGETVYIEGDASAGFLAFGANTASQIERMRIINNGNIGIGTTVPGTLLDVAGAITSRPSGTGTGQTGQLIMRELAASGTNTATIRSPDTLAADYVLTLPVDDGTPNQVLTTDGSGVLSWTTAGAATSVSASAGTVGAPSVSFSGDPDTGFYSSAANTIGLSAGGANIFNISSVGMVAATTGGGVVTTDNGTAATPTFSFAGDTGTGWWRPAASTLAASTGGAEKLRIDSSGKVGIGTASPRDALDVNGSIVSQPAIVNDNITPVNFSLGNIQYTANNCGPFVFHNLHDGGSYSFIVQGTTLATCSFTAYSDAGSTLLTVHMPTDHGATTSGKHTVYNMMVAGTHIYFSWTPGY